MLKPFFLPSILILNLTQACSSFPRLYFSFAASNLLCTGNHNTKIIRIVGVWDLANARNIEAASMLIAWSVVLVNSYTWAIF